MRFLLLLCADTTEVTDYEVPCEEWSKEMAERGVLLDALGLPPPATARTVRVRADEVLHTDGPFAETKEQMGGITVVECADRAEWFGIDEAREKLNPAQAEFLDRLP